MDQRADKAKGRKKPSPPTPPRAKVSGFKILPTRAAHSDSKSEADDEEAEGESQGKACSNLARYESSIDGGQSTGA